MHFALSCHHLCFPIRNAECTSSTITAVRVWEARHSSACLLSSLGKSVPPVQPVAAGADAVLNPTLHPTHGEGGPRHGASSCIPHLFWPETCGARTSMARAKSPTTAPARCPAAALHQEALQGAPRQPCPSPVGSVLPCLVSSGHPELQHAPAEKDGLRGAAWPRRRDTPGRCLAWETLDGERQEGCSRCPSQWTGPTCKLHPRAAPKHVQRKEGRRQCGLEMSSHEGAAIPTESWGAAQRGKGLSWRNLTGCGNPRAGGIITFLIKSFQNI